MVHSPDIRDGSRQDEDEWALLHLSKIPLDIVRIPLIVSTYAASGQPPAFGQVSGATFNMTNQDTGQVVQAYDLTKDFREARVIYVGDYRRTEPSSRVFEFKPKGDASPHATLPDALKSFGLPF